MPKTAKSKEPEDSFEARLKHLEELVAQLEAGELPLEQAVKAFEEGMAISRQLSETLAAVEKRIEVLLAQEGGEVVRKPFAADLEEPEE